MIKCCNNCKNIDGCIMELVMLDEFPDKYFCDNFIPQTSPNGDFSNEKEHNISLKESANTDSQIEHHDEQKKLGKPEEEFLRRLDGDGARFPSALNGFNVSKVTGILWRFL